MAGMTSPPPLNSPAAAPAGLSPANDGFYGSLSVKSTVLYIGEALFTYLESLAVRTLPFCFLIRYLVICTRGKRHRILFFGLWQPVISFPPVHTGLSLGVLLVILVLLTMTLFICIRPGRRRREGEAFLDLHAIVLDARCDDTVKRQNLSSEVLLAAIAAMQRQRAEGVQAAKTEEVAFVPQKRQYPVVVLQPYTSDVAYGRKVSVEKSDLPAVTPAAADPEDPEKGANSAQASSGATQEQQHYNLLTHYMTGDLRPPSIAGFI